MGHPCRTAWVPRGCWIWWCREEWILNSNLGFSLWLPKRLCLWRLALELRRDSWGWNQSKPDWKYSHCTKQRSRFPRVLLWMCFSNLTFQLDSVSSVELIPKNEGIPHWVSQVYSSLGKPRFLRSLEDVQTGRKSEGQPDQRHWLTSFVSYLN